MEVNFLQFQKVGNMEENIWIPVTDRIPDDCFDTVLSEDKSLSKAMNDLKKYSAETYYHSFRVAMYAAYLANILSIDRLMVVELVKGALVHDIGKLKVSYDLLNYNGKFNSEQRNKIRQHPLYGIDYFNENEIKISSSIHDIVLQHHEYCDGTGYPYGLCMKDLNDFSQIVTICDVFEAYTSKRIYHPNRSLDEGVDYLLYLSCNDKINKNFTKAFIDNISCILSLNRR